LRIFIKMKKELFVEIEIPEGIEVVFRDETFKTKGPEGENERKFDLGKLKVETSKEKIKIGNVKSTKNDKKRMNTIAAHIKNMIKGVQEKFEYELKVCSGHFPMTVNQEGNKIIVKNFLGEKINREAKIIDGVEVEIDKEKIILKSMDREKAGQTAANFEHATKVRGRDKRVFQDGIYIIKKAGKEI